MGAARRSSTGRARPGSEGNGIESLPAEIYTKIFCLIPAREIASSCALVCRSWRSFSSCETLWKELCDGSGLRHVDAMRHATWRALFGAVYGTNLIASPYFERLDHIDANRLECGGRRTCVPRCTLYPDTLYYENERHDEHHSFCHWSADGGSRFQRGGGDGIVRECPPVGCPPYPGAPEKPVLATSYDWGKVYQTVDLRYFPAEFLDRSPAFLLSVWYAGRRGSPGLFRMQVGLRDQNSNVLVSKFSGDLKAKSNKWREAKRVIHGYPKGMRSIVVKFSGMSQERKRGFHGAKCTAIRMQFIAPSEAQLQIEAANPKTARPQLAEVR